MTQSHKAAKDKKPYRITVRFDDTDYSKICSEAEALGVTVSNLIRVKMAGGYIRIPKYAKIDAAAMNQLSKLGGLLKMIHTESGGIHGEKTLVILRDIREVIAKIRDSIGDDREACSETQGA